MPDGPSCKVGDRIKLLTMPFDPCPIPEGATGTVLHIQQLFHIKEQEYQITVNWDINRSLSLIWPIDTFEVIPHAADLPKLHSEAGSSYQS